MEESNTFIITLVRQEDRQTHYFIINETNLSDSLLEIVENIDNEEEYFMRLCKENSSLAIEAEFSFNEGAPDFHKTMLIAMHIEKLFNECEAERLINEVFGNN